MRYHIGFDVGGTFTDFTLLDAETNAVEHYKVPSTPHDPSLAIHEGLEQLMLLHGLDADGFARVGHGTTVATNLIIERKGVPVGLLVTKGFRDVLEIGRQTRPHLYNYRIQKPAPVVPRHLRLEIDERILADGTVLKPLDPAEVEAAARTLAEAGVEAVAICFMHSYRRRDHEIEAAMIVRRILPDAYVCISSEILPEFREFERMSTTVLNAYVAPKMGVYVGRLTGRLAELGIRVPVTTVHSNGGVMSEANVREVPVRTCVSGPAAGVNGSAVIGAAAGFDNIITFDVGGTSTDVALIVDGRPLFASDRLIADYPVKMPMIDINVIGAGGGSIAAIDDAGALKVGPRSAGAVPGPVCYGKGGTEPTITDANLCLGRLDSRTLLKGRMALDLEAARRVISDRVARPLGISLEEAAHGIVRIANANMARAIRSVSTERGYDIRDFVLFAYGGAGPLHAAELARDTSIRTVLVPREPGTLCSRGILLSDVTMDFVATVLARVGPQSWPQVVARFDRMSAEAFDWLEREGVPAGSRALRYFIDARYEGQNFELAIEVGAEGARDCDRFLDAFRAAHEREYGYVLDERDVEIVNCRIQAIGEVIKVPQPPIAGGASLGDAQVDLRAVYFTGGWQETPVYDREKLPVEQPFSGPAIINEMSSTTVLLPGQTARVDRIGNIIITV